MSHPIPTVIREFYSKLLTSPQHVTEEILYQVISEDYVSVPTPPAGPGAEGMFNTLKIFGQSVPDLKWEPVQILTGNTAWTQDGVTDVEGEHYIIRSKATGTPTGPFLSVEQPTGKQFEIMSIDILTVKNNRVVNSYHMEDWISAVMQLTHA